MSLATRCPACSTVFRVVQDQLRVSEGWVRCGRCSEVFNAVDHMVDLPRPAPPATARVVDAPAPPAPAPAPIDVSAGLGAFTAEPGLVASDHAHDPAMGRWDAPAPVADGGVVQDEFHEDDDRTRTYAAYRSDAMTPGAAVGLPLDGVPAAAGEAVEGPGPADPESDRPAEPSAAAAHAAEVDAGVDAAASAAAEPAAEASPTFLRDAERAERWRRPAVRRALAAEIVGGALLLVLQVAIEYRDLVAARWVAMRPALEQVCRWTGCRVEPPRIVDALVVDSSGLVRVEGTNSYRFSVVLRNRSPLTLAMPAIDLTLTDTLGRVIARRTLTAAELGVVAPTVAAAAELPMQATLGIAERAVAGYTIEVFYP